MLARKSKIHPDEVAALVEPGMWLDFGFGLSQPDLFDRALSARTELCDVNIRSALSMRPRAILEEDASGERFRWFSWHFSGYDRQKHDQGRCNYIPMNFGEAPDYYRRFIAPVDMVVVKTCPVDENGFYNFGGSCTYSSAMVERARVVVVETCESMPYAYGQDNGVHASKVDYVIEGEGAMPELRNPPQTEIDRKVATQIVGEIEPGACLQIGIGGMPNAVCAMIKDAGIKDLGIHTEMMTDGIVDLYEAGLINGARKNIDRSKIVYTFAAGSARQYATIHRNKDFKTCPVDYTNLPHNIMQNSQAVSVNNTTQIDLQGQAASESDGHRHISGTGGQLQFVRGAYASQGGKSFICLSSIYEKGSRKHSRIVSSLTPGNVVTTPRTDTMYVVTEYGMVNLKGKSVSERAQALIAIAHPDCREQLEREAREKNIIPKMMF